MRLVLVSFAFLGWAFYELSGGADFQPRSARAVPAEPVTDIAETEPAEDQPIVLASSAVELVAQPVIAAPAPADLASVSDVAEPVTESLVAPEDALARIAQSGALTSDQSLFADDQQQGVTLASLQQGLLSAQTVTDVAAPDPSVPQQAPEPAQDIREIIGTRVNMRDGPGTIYPVISRLNIGHQVEVLDSSGTGWLRLRVLPERQIGWIAASLVSKKAQ